MPSPSVSARSGSVMKPSTPAITSSPSRSLSPSVSGLVGSVCSLISSMLGRPSRSSSSLPSGIPFPLESIESGFRPRATSTPSGNPSLSLSGSRMFLIPSPSLSLVGFISLPSNNPSPSVSASIGLDPRIVSCPSSRPSLSVSLRKTLVPKLNSCRFVRPSWSRSMAASLALFGSNPGPPGRDITWISERPGVLLSSAVAVKRTRRIPLRSSGTATSRVGAGSWTVLELKISAPPASKAWKTPAKKSKPTGFWRLPSSRICATFTSDGNVTSIKGALRLLAASPIPVNHEVWLFPSIARVGGKLLEKLLAFTCVPGNRARLAPPGFTLFACS